MQAQQRRGWSCGHPQSSFDRSEPRQRRRRVERGEREDGRQPGRRQLRVRLGDRQQRVVVAAGAVVVVVMAGSTRRRTLISAFVGICGGVVVRLVAGAAPGRVGVGNLPNRSGGLRGIARLARREPHAKVAAAEGHRDRQKQCDEQAECAAAMEHARKEYIGSGRCTLDRASGFGVTPPKPRRSSPHARVSCVNRPFPVISLHSSARTGSWGLRIRSSPPHRMFAAACRLSSGLLAHRPIPCRPQRWFRKHASPSTATTRRPALRRPHGSARVRRALHDSPPRTAGCLCPAPAIAIAPTLRKPP